MPEFIKRTRLKQCYALYEILYDCEPDYRRTHATQFQVHSELNNKF